MVISAIVLHQVNHIAIRIAIQTPAYSAREPAYFQASLTKHTVFCSVLSLLHNEHSYLEDAFLALADFKNLAHKARALALPPLPSLPPSVLLRATPTTHGAKLLTAATALLAHRNRQLTTLIRYCEAWELVEHCFDTITFECTNVTALAQIVPGFTRGDIAERGDAVCNLPWSQTEIQVQMACHTACIGGQGEWVPSCPFASYVQLLGGTCPSPNFAASRTVS